MKKVELQATTGVEDEAVDSGSASHKESRVRGPKMAAFDGKDDMGSYLQRCER